VNSSGTQLKKRDNSAYHTINATHLDKGIRDELGVNLDAAKLAATSPTKTEDLSPRHIGQKIVNHLKRKEDSKPSVRFFLLDSLSERLSYDLSYKKILQSPMFAIKPVKAGFMQYKKSHRWKKRWVILDANTLYCFKKMQVCSTLIAESFYFDRVATIGYW